MIVMMVMMVMVANSVMIFKLFSTDCITEQSNQRVTDWLRSRELLSAAGCATLLPNKILYPGRRVQEKRFRNLFPSLSTAERKRCCTSTRLRF